jgi:GTPase
VFTDRLQKLHFSHERYLMNQIRKRFGFEGTPIQLNIRGRKSQEKKAREKR